MLRHGAALRDHDDVFIRKDGTFFPVVYSSTPLVAEGKTLGLVVVFRDVTERKRAEEAQARLAAIVESDGMPYFFKLLGPAEQVDASRAAFDRMLDGITLRAAK